MKYRFWVFQDEAPPWALAGNAQAPYPDDPIRNDLRYPGKVVDGVVRTVDEIMTVFREHGVDDEVEATVIRGKAMESLSGGVLSYRTALPTPGRYLLAEPAALKGEIQA